MSSSIQGAGSGGVPPIPAELRKIKARLERAHPFVALLSAAGLCWRGRPRFEGQCAQLVRAAYFATALERPSLELQARAWVAALAPWALAAADKARARLAAEAWCPGAEHDAIEASRALAAIAAVLAVADTDAAYLRINAAQDALLEEFSRARAAAQAADPWL